MLTITDCKTRLKKLKEWGLLIQIYDARIQARDFSKGWPPALYLLTNEFSEGSDGLVFNQMAIERRIVTLNNGLQGRLTFNPETKTLVYVHNDFVRDFKF